MAINIFFINFLVTFLSLYNKWGKKGFSQKKNNIDIIVYAYMLKIHWAEMLRQFRIPKYPNGFTFQTELIRV